MAYREPTTRPDFDDEARKLFARINLAGPSRNKFNNADPIYKHPETGAPSHCRLSTG